METKFNSQICTTREQSERLLALGLKVETADMGIYYSELYGVDRVFSNDVFDEKPTFDSDEIPAWSLHRLIEILDTNPCVFYTNCGYDNIIDRIEEYIKEGFIDTRYMNEEYLDEEEEL